MTNRLLGTAAALLSLGACLWLLFGTTRTGAGEAAGVDEHVGLDRLPEANATRPVERIQPRPFRRDVRVQGTVCDVERRALGGAVVRCVDSPSVSAKSDAEGLFVLHGGSDEPWPLALEVSLAGYSTRTISVGVSETEGFTVILTAAADGLHALKLTVLHPAGQPLTHFQTAMLKAQTAGSGFRPFALPVSAAHESQDGSVLLSTPHSCIDLMILAAGLEPLNREGLDLSTSTPDHPLSLDVTLRSGARVLGTVILSGGAPGEPLEIALIPKGFVTLPDTSPGSQVAPVLLATALRSKSARLAFIGDRASFILDGVAEGDYQLVVLDATRSFLSPRQDLYVVAASMNGPFDIQASLGVAVTVRVVMGRVPISCDGRLHPVRRTVEAPAGVVTPHIDPTRAKPAATQFAHAGADGQLRFAHVSCGEYTLNISLEKVMSEHALWQVSPALASELGQLMAQVVPDIGKLDVVAGAPGDSSREIVVDLSPRIEAFVRWRSAKGRDVVRAEFVRHEDIIRARDQDALTRHGIAMEDLPFYSIERRLGAIERCLARIENPQAKLAPELIATVNEGDLASLIQQVLCATDPAK